MQVQKRKVPKQTKCQFHVVHFTKLIQRCEHLKVRFQMLKHEQVL